MRDPQVLRGARRRPHDGARRTESLRKARNGTGQDLSRRQIGESRAAPLPKPSGPDHDDDRTDQPPPPRLPEATRTVGRRCRRRRPAGGSARAQAAQEALPGEGRVPAAHEEASQLRRVPEASSLHDLSHGGAGRRHAGAPQLQLSGRDPEAADQGVQAPLRRRASRAAAASPTCATSACIAVT